MKNLLMKLNEENYHNFIEVNSKKELASKTYEYLMENEMIDEESGITKDIIESWIDWEDYGTYALVGWSFGVEKIQKIETILSNELDHFEFPFSKSLQMFQDLKTWAEETKKKQGYDYIYFVCHNRHVVQPNEYTLKYIVYSNKEIKDVISYLNENEKVWVGEFNTLGANHFVEELSDFDMTELYKYNFDSYESIEIEQ